MCAEQVTTKKCVLAYSGGLDTSAIVVWLVERGYDVHALLVDVGQDEDLEALSAKALRLGAATVQIADAKPEMFATVVPKVIGLASTYEGNYRLGTALARPFIALKQVELAKKLGGATLVHGATGKGNDQIRFEFAYKSLAPQCPILAPWKTWQFTGRLDLIEYLQSKGFDDAYEAKKDYSLDENLWHLSIEGSELEDPDSLLDVESILAHFKHRFASQATPPKSGPVVSVTIENGVPVALDGQLLSLEQIVAALNGQFRHASWAWDLVLENRTTGIKSRGVYINPAAKLLQLVADGLARACLNKCMYDKYVSLGTEYGQMLYRGEYFSAQLEVINAAADALLAKLNGTITLQLAPVPYVARIEATQSIFSLDLATFEHSSYDHHDAQGFINLSWLARIGRPIDEATHEDTVETTTAVAPDVCTDQPLAETGLVSAAP